MIEKYAVAKSGLDFIIEIELEYTIKLGEDWINVEENELQAWGGTVVYDPKEIWGIGYKTSSWAACSFEVLEKDYLLKVDNDNEMFEIIFFKDNEFCYGGWYKDEIEWDGNSKINVPLRYRIEELENEIKSKIKKQ